jgi:glycosyltransferase involved in cell wall biosynthesis
MLEAMACGVPVVTTRCGGPESLIDDTVGVSVRSKRPEELADAILEIVRNRGHYDAARLRQFVQERYSKQKVGQMMIASYEKAIEGFQRG